jgi:hypothetical protein
MNVTTSTEQPILRNAAVNYLPLAFWLERSVRSLKVTQENLDNQRSAVEKKTASLRQSAIRKRSC